MFIPVHKNSYIKVIKKIITPPCRGSKWNHMLLKQFERKRQTQGANSKCMSSRVSAECLLGLVARSTSPLGVVGLPGILGRGKRAFSRLNPTFSTTPRKAAETWGETKRWAAFYDGKGTVVSTAI